MARPKCPGHHCEMEPTNNPRIYICPISGWKFECDVDEQSTRTKLDKFGRIMKNFKVAPVGGEERSA